MSPLLRLERQQKDFIKSISIAFYFLAFSFGNETTNMFLHVLPRCSLENRFQTKMGKDYTRFQTRRDAKTIPFKGGGGYTCLYGLYKEAPPGINLSSLVKELIN